MALIDQRLIANGGLFTEVDSVAADDATGLLTATSSVTTFTNLTNSGSYYRYADFGAAYFNEDFIIEGELLVSSMTNTTGSGLNFIGVSDGIGPESSVTNGLYFRFGGGQGATNLNSWGFVRRTTSTNNNSFFTTTGNLNTTYYYRLSRTSAAGGANGIVLLEIFSDVGRTTIIESKNITMPGAQSYRYFYSVQGYNYTSNTSMSGTNSNINITIPSKGLDVTTFSKYDIYSVLTYPNVNCSQLQASGQGTNSAYNYKDYGANYFNNGFSVKSVLNVTSYATATTNKANLNVFTNTIADGASTSDRHCIALRQTGTTTYTLNIEEITGGTTYSSANSNTLNFNTPYWLDFHTNSAVGAYGTLYLTIYSDPALQVQIGSTISLALSATKSFRYYMSVQSHPVNITRTITYTNGGIFVSLPSASTTSYVSGGFVLGGSITPTKSSHFTVSGGMVLGGNVTYTKGKTSYVTGGLIFGGPVSYYKGSISTVTGGIVLGGNVVATYNGQTIVYSSVSGGLVLGGNITSYKSSTSTVTGGLVLGGVVSYSYTLQNNVQEIVFKITDSNGLPITGATTVTCKLRTTPGAKLFDWRDTTFKSSGWSTVAGQMTEVDPVNLPGVYKIEVNVTDFPTGRYQVFITYSATVSQHGEAEFYIDEGQMVDEYTATKADLTLVKANQIPNNPLLTTDTRIDKLLTTAQFLGLK